MAKATPPELRDLSFEEIVALEPEQRSGHEHEWIDVTTMEQRRLSHFICGIEGCGATRYAVSEDGTVSLPDGRELRGLTPGHYLVIPRVQELCPICGKGRRHGWDDCSMCGYKYEHSHNEPAPT